MSRIYKVVLTGGPCAGKSTALKFIKDYFTKQGYVVYTVPETATELMSNGVEIYHFPNLLQYQKCQMRLHKAQEEAFVYAASVNRYINKNSIIICDRGQFDCRAYMSPTQFNIAMVDCYGSEKEISKVLDSYDAVFHLTTAAKGAEIAYTVENNKVRTETPEEAIKLDDKLQEAWEGHNYHVVIPSYESFTDKLNHLKKEIEKFLEK